MPVLRRSVEPAVISGHQLATLPRPLRANRVAYCPHIIKTERQAVAPRQIDDPMLVYL